MTVTRESAQRAPQAPLGRVTEDGTRSVSVSVVPGSACHNVTPSAVALPHYDYQHQCWIVAGPTGPVVDVCGHGRNYPPCYSCQHEGEAHTCQGECA